MTGDSNRALCDSQLSTWNDESSSAGEIDRQSVLVADDQVVAPISIDVCDIDRTADAVRLIKKDGLDVRGDPAAVNLQRHEQRGIECAGIEAVMREEGLPRDNFVATISVDVGECHAVQLGQTQP